MTVSTDIKSVRYEGNGVTDTFAFNGRMFTTSDLAVDILTRATDAVVETLSPSDYTVSIVSDESAEIVIDAGKIPSASQDILIYRSIDREQNLRLPTGTVFPAKDVEDALDKTTILIQDVASDVDRVLKFPLNVSGITAANLPAPVDGAILTWFGTTGTIANADIADLSSSIDTVLTTLTSGDFLTWDGTNWINVHKSALPIDAAQATGSAGLALKNSGGTSVLTVGAGAGTGATFAGGVNVSGAVSTTGYLTVTGTSSSPAYITLAEDTDNGTNKVTVIAPSSIASDYTVTLPSSAGTLLLSGTQDEIEAETSGKGMDGANAKYHPAMPKAWVNFNGTGTVAIRASYNVSSITDNGTGNYTVNLTNALSSANYCVNVSASQSTTSASTGAAAKVDNLATGSFRIQTSGDGTTSSTLVDNAQVMATVWGDFA